MFGANVNGSPQVVNGSTCGPVLPALVESISFEDIRLTQMQAVNQMDSMHKQKPVGSGKEQIQGITIQQIKNGKQMHVTGI